MKPNRISNRLCADSSKTPWDIQAKGGERKTGGTGAVASQRELVHVLSPLIRLRTGPDSLGRQSRRPNATGSPQPHESVVKVVDGPSVAFIRDQLVSVVGGLLIARNFAHDGLRTCPQLCTSGQEIRMVPRPEDLPEFRLGQS